MNDGNEDTYLRVEERILPGSGELLVKRNGNVLQFELTSACASFSFMTDRSEDIVALQDAINRIINDMKQV
jgi:hypothetical protein